LAYYGFARYGVDTYGSTCDHGDLLICFREDVAPELAALTETDASADFELWKWAYYHWKYNRAVGGLNAYFLYNNPALYFERVDTSIIEP